MSRSEGVASTLQTLTMKLPWSWNYHESFHKRHVDGYELCLSLSNRIYALLLVCVLEFMQWDTEQITICLFIYIKALWNADPSQQQCWKLVSCRNMSIRPRIHILEDDPFHVYTEIPEPVYVYLLLLAERFDQQACSEMWNLTSSYTQRVPFLLPDDPSWHITFEQLFFYKVLCTRNCHAWEISRPLDCAWWFHRIAFQTTKERTKCNFSVVLCTMIKKTFDVKGCSTRNTRTCGP